MWRVIVTYYTAIKEYITVISTWLKINSARAPCFLHCFLCFFSSLSLSHYSLPRNLMLFQESCDVQTNRECTEHYKYWHWVRYARKFQGNFFTSPVQEKRSRVFLYSERVHIVPRALPLYFSAHTPRSVPCTMYIFYTGIPKWFFYIECQVLLDIGSL